jgi:histone deacetylase 11
MDINARHHHEDASYLQELQRTLPQSFDDFEPDFVIYNAGTDCMEGDELGRMKLTATAIIERDEMVFFEAL